MRRLGGRGCRRGWHERHVIAAQRTIDKRLLRIACCLQDIVADEAERLSKIEARFGEMIDQRGCERAVLAIAVGCGRSRLRGKCDHGVGAGRLDLGKPAADRARRDRPLHAFRERIVPARIEDHQPQLLRRLDRNQHTVERQRLVQNIRIGFKRRIDRDEIVGAIQLDAVPGIIDNRDIGVAAPVAEVAQRLAQLADGQVQFGLDRVEARRLEHRGNSRRVVRGIAELGHVPVGRIADHQRHALLGKRGLPSQQSQPGRQDHPQKRAHQKISKSAMKTDTSIEFNGHNT